MLQHSASLESPAELLLPSSARAQLASASELLLEDLSKIIEAQGFLIYHEEFCGLRSGRYRT